VSWSIYKGSTLVASFSETGKNISPPAPIIHNSSGGWGVLPTFCLDNDFDPFDTAAPRSYAIFVPKTATAGAYTLQWTDTYQAQWRYVNTPGINPYTPATRTGTSSFNVVAGTGTPPSPPTNVTATLRYGVVKNIGAPTNLPATVNCRYFWYPKISWTPPAGTRLVSITTSSTAPGIGTTTTPAAIYDVLGTDSNGTFPGNTFYYALPTSPSSPDTGAGTFQWRSQLQDGYTYTFNLQARNAYGVSAPVSVSITMPSYPQLQGLGPTEFLAEVPFAQTPNIGTFGAGLIYSPAVPFPAHPIPGQEFFNWQITGPSGGTPDNPQGWSVSLRKAPGYYDNAQYYYFDPVACAVAGGTTSYSFTDGYLTVSHTKNASGVSVPAGRYQAFGAWYQFYSTGYQYPQGYTGYWAAEDGGSVYWVPFDVPIAQ